MMEMVEIDEPKSARGVSASGLALRDATIGALTFVGLGIAIGGFFYARRKSAASASSTLPSSAAAPPIPRTNASTFTMMAPDGSLASAMSVEELRVKLLAAYGSKEQAMMAPVFLPGDTAWHPAGGTVFGQVAVSGARIASVHEVKVARRAREKMREHMNGRGGGQLGNR